MPQWSRGLVRRTVCKVQCGEETGWNNQTKPVVCFFLCCGLIIRAALINLPEQRWMGGKSEPRSEDKLFPIDVLRAGSDPDCRETPVTTTTVRWSISVRRSRPRTTQGAVPLLPHRCTIAIKRWNCELLTETSHRQVVTNRADIMECR